MCGPATASSDIARTPIPRACLGERFLGERFLGQRAAMPVKQSLSGQKPTWQRAKEAGRPVVAREARPPLPFGFGAAAFPRVASELWWAP
jgi:hypothetical protein